MTDPIQAHWADRVAGLLLPRLGKAMALVEDPHRLLAGEVILRLGEQGWRVTPVAVPLELRLAYEQDYRASAPADGEKQAYLLLFPASQAPYDIRLESELVTLTLKDYFPKLSEKVLQQLPPAWLAIIEHNLGLLPASAKPLSEAQTAEFVLESCLGVDLPCTPSPAAALGLLADLALYDLELPPVLIQYLLQRVGTAWPGDFASLAGAPARSRRFLQQAWQAYLNSFSVDKPAVAEAGSEALAAASDLLARDRGLQSRVSALLAENLLQAPTIQPAQPLPDWVRQGVHFHLDHQSFLAQWLQQLSERLPGENATREDWMTYAWKWAEWRRSLYQQAGTAGSLQERMRETQARLEQTFLGWLQQRYSDLLSQPYLPTPSMVHQVLHYLAARFHPSEREPLALVVVDGMAIEDWLVLRGPLAEQNPGWQIQEASVLALVPSITPVSRQALLSGRLPRNFSGDWLSTKTEEAAWRHFWEGRGLHPSSIAYQRGLGSLSGPDGSLEDATRLALSQPHQAVAALVVNTLDDLMHNNLLGANAFLEQVATWGRQGYLQALLSHLLDRYTTVIITADHGHVEGVGMGDMALKEAAVERSLRTRIFPDQAYALVERDAAKILAWGNAGLPDEARVFIPAGLGLFAKPGMRAISHGGAALEEVIIPIITLTRML